MRVRAAGNPPGSIRSSGDFFVHSRVIRVERRRVPPIATIGGTRAEVFDAVKTPDERVKPASRGQVCTEMVYRCG